MVAKFTPFSDTVIYLTDPFPALTSASFECSVKFQIVILPFSPPIIKRLPSGYRHIELIPKSANLCLAKNFP